MDKLVKIVTKVIKVLVTNGFTFKSEDNCEDGLSYLEIEGHEVIVGDDNEREDWNVYLKDIKKDGVKVTHEELERMVSSVLKTSKKVVDRTDMVVHNWEPQKNILVVQCDNEMEFHQDYIKR